MFVAGEEAVAKAMVLRQRVQARFRGLRAVWVAAPERVQRGHFERHREVDRMRLMIDAHKMRGARRANPSPCLPLGRARGAHMP
ncbi:hypothetical protein SDC9_136177 [bioreactor metagenome]|uniref:Uncharacterized protein n=1 Tax=bioreactor metagenome TaxID=1076179 RepID=A0A645DIE6_9ZZZZ